MVDAVREAEKSIGIVNYELTKKQLKGRDFSRSIYVINNIKKGDILSELNIKSIRPGFGLHPKYYKEILGKQVNRTLKKGDRFDLEFLK